MRDVSSYYDALAEGYDELYGEEQTAKHVACLKAIGCPRGVVCDVGCGTCLLLEALTRYCNDPFYYVALDVSLGMLSKCRARVEDLGVVGDLVVGDASNPPLRRCDYLYAISVLTINEPVELAARLAGRFCVSVLGSSICPIGGEVYALRSEVLCAGGEEADDAPS